MATRSPNPLHRPLAAAAALALLGGFAFQAAPAQAQDNYVGEVVISPPDYGPDGPRRLSRVVYVGDLDLTTGYGQQIMKHRVRATARDVCRELGEGPNNGSPIVPSCDDEAYRSARTQMRVAVNRAFESRAYAYATESYPYATDASDRVPY